MKSISTLFRQLFLIVVLISAFSLSAWGEEVTVSLAKGKHANSQITWTENNFIVEQTRGNVTTAVNSSYISAPRVYKGHILSFTANSGYKITKISITYNSTYKGNTIVVGTDISNNKVVADSNIFSTISSSSGGTHTFTPTNGVECIHIQNLATENNVQLRPTTIKVTIVEDNESEPTLVAPTFSVDSKSFTSPFTVTLSCETEGADIYYNTIAEDGEYSLYENEINISETTTIYAKSKLGETESEVVSKTYTKLNISNTPTIADFLSADVSADVWYTLTGVVSNITNTTYGNFDLTDETGTVYVYGLTKEKAESNNQSFSSLNIGVNDTLTISTVRGEYNGNPQGGGSNTPAYYISNKKYKAPTYTITFYNGNKKLTEITTSEIDLSKYILPLNQACQEEGWVFAGWSTEPNITEDTENPNVLTGVYQPNVNISLYPVYKKEETTSSPESWNKTNIAEIKPTDEVVITMSNATSTYALNTANGSSKAPEAVSIKVSNEKLSNDPLENQIWNIVLEEDSYIIYPNGVTNKWLYCTNTNNGVRVGIGDAKKFIIKDNYLQNIETDDNRYIGIYNSQDWRCYTTINNNIKDQTLAFYIKTGGTQVTTTYRSTLDCIEEIEMEVGYNDTLYHNQNNILYNTLTIKSNGDQAGQINVTNGSISANKVILEKTIDDSRWFFFSLPFDCNVAGIVAIAANGDSLTYYTHYVISKYNPTRKEGQNNAWEDLFGTDKLNANQGYIIGHWYEQSDTIIVKFPSTDPQTISAPEDKTLDYTNTWFVGGENSSKGFNLIGMPYYQNINSTISCDSVYIYSTIPNEDGKTYTQEKYTGNNNNVAPFTSFFVQVKAAPTFTITETQSAAPMLRAKDVVDKATITLTDANGGADETTVINNPTKTTDYEIGHDLVKWIGYASIPQIYSLQGDEMLAFNSLAIDNSTVIPLGVYAHADGEYTFALNEKSVGDLAGWELYDNETGSTTRLANEDLTVNLAQGTHEGRFEIRLQQRITTDCDNSMGDMTTWTANGTLNINNLPADAVVYIYDAVGRMIYAANNNSTAFNYTFAARGVYNIVVRSADNTVSFKTIY